MNFTINHIYYIIYWIICVVMFGLIFKIDEIFNFCFEKKYNNITDYNDPNFTGGFEYIFKLFHNIKVFE